MTYAAIFVGGGLGSLCRFYLSQANAWGAWPLGTILANFLSCIVLGFTTTYLAQKGSTSLLPIKALIGIGFCGGFSTFSTFSLETYQMLQKSQFTLAFAHVNISMLVCLLGLWLGMGLFIFFSR